jgi:hypothetical protein
MKDKDTHLLEEAYSNISKESTFKKILEYIEDMEEDDCIISSDGFKYNVSCGGKHLAEFGDMDKALDVVKNWREENQFWPTIWFVSDHGNYWPIDEEGNEIKDDEPYEMSDVEADANTLASAGYGTDEDYGHYSGD